MLLFSKKIVIISCLLFIHQSIFAQVELNKELIFTNENDSLNQIFGISDPLDSASLANFSNGTSEKLITLRLTGQGNYFFSIPYTGFNLKIGMQLHFLIDSSNLVSDPVVNTNSGVFIIKNQSGNSINAGEIEHNSVLRVIFNGTEFRLIQYFRNSCPPGFISINENYCIETNERPVTIYTTAIHICNSMNANLCSWAEWYHACVNFTGAGVFQMQNNWEFIDDASDHTETNAVVGGSGCMNFFSENVDLFNRNFRCCYKK